MQSERILATRDTSLIVLFQKWENLKNIVPKGDKFVIIIPIFSSAGDLALVIVYRLF